MRIIIICLLLLWQLATASAVQAQCLALADLLPTGAEATALVAPSAVTRHLAPEWSLNNPIAPSREVFWTLPAADGAALPVARLQMRAQRPGQVWCSKPRWPIACANCGAS